VNTHSLWLKSKCSKTNGILCGARLPPRSCKACWCASVAGAPSIGLRGVRRVSAFERCSLRPFPKIPLTRLMWREPLGLVEDPSFNPEGIGSSARSGQEYRPSEAERRTSICSGLQSKSQTSCLPRYGWQTPASSRVALTVPLLRRPFL
jgi:hypothetical protein